MEPRDLAGMGENTLRVWASQVGISANKSDPDKTGWDFFLEMPRESAHSETLALPLDKVPQPISCLVQVKSTDQRPKKWQVKLSNWVSLVKKPLPTFFLVLEFDGEEDCQRAYLVHVGETYITRVLKRLREQSPDRLADLHKKTLQFQYSEVDRLSSPDGKGLSQAIRSHVGALETYAEWKSEVLRTAGYEDGKWQIHAVVPPPTSGAEAEEYLIDFLLGLIPRIEATRIEVRDIRFGIVSLEAQKSFPQGTVIELARKQPVGTGMILLCTSDGARQLRLDTEIFVPQGAAFELREELFKARFAAPFVDFIVSPFQPGSCEFRYDLPNLRQQHSLRRLRPLSEFILLLDWAGTHNEKIEFEARVDSKPLVTGHIQVREALSRQVVDFATGIAQTWAVATHFNIQDTVQLAPIELRGQEEQITIIASVVGPSGPRVRIVHWCSDCLPSDEKPMYVPYVTDALIGQYRVAIAAAFIGQPKATGNIANEENDRLREFEIETRDLRLCRQCLCARDEVPRYTLSDLAQSVVKKYDESHHLLVAEGINDHLFHSQQRGKSNDTGGRACC